MKAVTLEPLRQDLELREINPGDDGTPRWLLYDKVAHNYFQLGWLEFEILSRWDLNQSQAIVDSVNRETTLNIKLENINVVAQFLETHNLIASNKNDFPSSLYNKLPPKFGVNKILKQYLFFIIPLISPDLFLRKTIRFIRPLFTRTALVILLILGIFSLYLLGRQWLQFFHTFDYIFSLSNIAIFVFSIIFVKIIHEFGHGYVATYYGCRISAMGVAFLVMWPVLYTDTTDAWKLKNPKQRIAIGAAGIAAELVLAIIATLLWFFLSDGVFRSICFFIATISWVSSLLLNLNPMLKFDGYYVLSDLIGVENLQYHAFTLAKWKLREWLFAFNEIKPFSFPKVKERLLLLYGFSTWIYRFFLFLAIAILVYFFFFKALGILLMIVELFYFLFIPIFGELKNYWQRRKKMKINKNSIVTFSVLALMLAILFIPWHTRISAPAVMEFTDQTKVYSMIEGQLVTVNVAQGEKIAKNDLLVQFTNPQIEFDLIQTKLDIQIIKDRLRLEYGKNNIQGHEQASPEELSGLEEKQYNLLKEKAKLTLTAPFNSIATSLAKGLSVGRWLDKDSFVTELVQPSTQVIYAYLGEEMLQRISTSSKAIFYPNEIDESSVPAKIVYIDKVATDTLPSPYLASIFGGKIAVYRRPDDTFAVKDAVYRIKLLPKNNNAKLTHVLTGKVIISGKRESFAVRIFRKIGSILVRESGF